MGSFGKAIIAVGIGNALEWFDFAIFGALADIIGFHFFPSDHATIALMSSFALYGTAFLMRPLGGILMGYLGDSYGRKYALELSVSLMAIPSFLMGSLPTFQSAGYAATILLVSLRMLQGLAVGGEMIGAYIYTVEGSQIERRGFWSGVCKATALVGTVMGMAFVTMLREVLSQAAMYHWGWRVPFLSSLVLGIVGLYFRSHLHESEAYLAMKAEADARKGQMGAATPVNSSWTTAWEVAKLHWLEIFKCILITAFWATGYYTCFIWMGYYTSAMVKGSPIKHAWLMNICMIFALVCMMPLGGHLGDVMCRNTSAETNVHTYSQKGTTGYRRMMAIGAYLAIILGIPAFYLINLCTTWSTALGQFIFVLSLSLYGSCMPVVLVTSYRYMAVGIAYNISNAIFAGSAPLIQTALVVYTTHMDNTSLQSVLPAVYLMCVGLVSVTALTWGPDSSAIEGREAAKEESRHSEKGSTASYHKRPLEIDDSMSSATSSMMDTSTSPMIRV